MRLTLTFLAAAACSALVYCQTQIGADVKVVKERLATFPGVGLCRVMFYQAEDMQSAGFTITSGSGRLLAEQWVKTPGLTERLDVKSDLTDMTRDGIPEITLVIQGGAKSFTGQVYEFDGQRLTKIGSWSGWRIEPAVVDGRRVVLYELTDQSLTDIFAWDEREFRKVNGEFPDYYRETVRRIEQTLYGDVRLPPNTFARDCLHSARALLYGESYDRAGTLCQQALKIVRQGSRLLFAEQASLAQRNSERKEAEDTIARVLSAIEAARKSQSKELDCCRDR